VSVQDARFCHPTFRLNRRGNGSPTICRLRPVEGSNVVGQDQDISGWEAPECRVVHHSKLGRPMSQLGHLRQTETLPTLAACPLSAKRRHMRRSKTRSLDHLVGASEKRGRNA
jgi:hypothetical protein